jgi:hypothetical protein
MSPSFEEKFKFIKSKLFLNSLNNILKNCEKNINGESGIN